MLLPPQFLQVLGPRPPFFKLPLQLLLGLMKQLLLLLFLTVDVADFLLDFPEGRLVVLVQFLALLPQLFVILPAFIFKLFALLGDIQLMLFFHYFHLLHEEFLLVILFDDAVFELLEHLLELFFFPPHQIQVGVEFFLGLVEGHHFLLILAVLGAFRHLESTFNFLLF